MAAAALEVIAYAGWPQGLAAMVLDRQPFMEPARSAGSIMLKQFDRVTNRSKVRRALRFGALALALSLSAGDVAWAAKKEKEPEAEKSYVMPYFLVLLTTAFGIMVVCRPGKRLDKERVPVADATDD